MRSRCRTTATGLIIALCALVSQAAQAVDIDKGLYGFWDLDVSRSHFGPNPALKMGMVSWNENGFASLLQSVPPSRFGTGMSA